MHNFAPFDSDMDNILDGKKKPLLNNGEFEEIDPSEFYIDRSDRDELNRRKETHMELAHQ